MPSTNHNTTSRGYLTHDATPATASRALVPPTSSGMHLDVQPGTPSHQLTPERDAVDRFKIILEFVTNLVRSARGKKAKKGYCISARVCQKLRQDYNCGAILLPLYSGYTINQVAIYLGNILQNAFPGNREISRLPLSAMLTKHLIFVKRQLISLKSRIQHANAFLDKRYKTETERAKARILNNRIIRLFQENPKLVISAAIGFMAASATAKFMLNINELAKGGKTFKGQGCKDDGLPNIAQILEILKPDESLFRSVFDNYLERAALDGNRAALEYAGSSLSFPKTLEQITAARTSTRGKSGRIVRAITTRQQHTTDTDAAIEMLTRSATPTRSNATGNNATLAQMLSTGSAAVPTRSAPVRKQGSATPARTLSAGPAAANRDAVVQQIQRELFGEPPRGAFGSKRSAGRIPRGRISQS